MAKRPTRPDADKGAEQLTSADIFGDMLAEVEAEVQRTSRAARSRESETQMEDIERKLEETLSGVIPTGGRSLRSGAAESRSPPQAPDDSEIDALLDQTLSSLDIPTRARKAARSKPPTSPAQTAAAAAPPTIGEGPSPPAIEEGPSPPTIEEVPLPPAIEDLAERIEDEAAPIRDVEPRFDRLPAPGDSVLDELLSPADQFRTQPLPVLDLRKEAAEGEPFGDYTLLERIALGGMAEVWRARRRGVEGFQKDVAIKKILSHLTGSQDFVTMFIDEAKLAAQLTHNNIIQIYDLGKVDNDFFIAMELVDGKDLRSILSAAQESRQPVPTGLGLSIVSALARALDYAHRKRDFDDLALGLVHRDVSPQNVLISYEGEIKLCDFGIVKAVAKASTTQMGALKGKLQYMSPEQAWGKTVDPRSDIFSLGSVLFEVLTGTQLFAGESEISVLDAVRECRVRSTREIVPEIPEAVDRIVQKALAKTPEKRFQTAGDMEHEIKDALDALGPAPSQKDLASYLHSLFVLAPAEATAPPAAVDVAPAVEEVAVPVATPVPAPAALPVATTVPVPVAAPVVEPNEDESAAAPSAPAEAAAPEGRSSLKWLVAAIVVAVLIGIGLLIARSMREEEPAVPATAQPAVVEEAAPEPLAGSPAAEASTTDVAPADASAGAQTTAVTEQNAAGEADTTGEQDAGEGEDAAEGEGDDGKDLATTASGVDIEQLVNDELTSRAERLRQDFEAEKKRIEDELAKTREPSPEPPPDDGETDGDESDGL